MAADMPVKAPLYKAPPPAPVYNWTGFYLGGSVGLRADQADPQPTAATFSQVGFPIVNSFTDCLDLPCAIGEPARGPTFRFAPYAGFNWQAAPKWVVGAEADWGWARRTTTLNGMFFPATPFILQSDFNSFVVQTSWDASVRARLGYLVNPLLLLYATGGPAWMRLETTSNCSTRSTPSSEANCEANPFPGFNGLLPPVISHSATLSGFTVGGGLEAMLGYGWFARGEYRYSAFGTFRATDVRTCANPCLFGPGITAAVLAQSYDVHVRTQSINFGLAYKFGDPATPVSPGAGTAYASKAPGAASPSWTGFYAGVGAGLRSTSTTASVTAATLSLPPNPVFDLLAACTGCTTSEPLGDDSFRFAPYLGYLWQIDQRSVHRSGGRLGFGKQDNDAQWHVLSVVSLLYVECE
jgi:outer membrane immunogenic protein